MYLPTVNGMRTFDGANALMDLAIASRAAAPTTTNATGVNTSDFGEFVGVLTIGVLGTATNVQMNLQESDTLAGTYTNIAGATVNTNLSNTCRVVSVNAKHPDRKPFMRIQTVATGNTSTFGAMSMRLSPKAGVISNDTNVVAVY